jgi:hypothetical protein
VVPIQRDWTKELTPGEIRQIAALVRQERGADRPFEVGYPGRTTGEDRCADAATVARFAEAGVTWWLEYFHVWVTPLNELRAHSPGPAARVERAFRMRRSPPSHREGEVNVALKLPAAADPSRSCHGLGWSRWGGATRSTPPQPGSQRRRPTGRAPRTARAEGAEAGARTRTT